MKKHQQTITIYDAGDGFHVEVIPTAETVELWLGHEFYGVKTLMYSVADPVDTIDVGVDLAEYIDIYKKEYFDD